MAKTPENEKYGHPKNTFHTVAVPGYSTSFYLSGGEIATLVAHLEHLGQPITKTEMGTLARKWFHEMMEQKKAMLHKM